MCIAAAAAGITAAASGGVAIIFFYQIMVAVQQIETALPVKKRKQLEYSAVSLYNLCHISIFPQFIPIPQFNIGISGFQIIFQGSSIQRLIFQKIIIGAAGTAVAVAEEDIF